MSTAETVKSERFSGYRILVFAVLFSFAWHVFWLSAIKVVAAPLRPSQTRFSKVSFLGQILAKVGLEVRAQPASLSLLEKRYLAASARPAKGSEPTMQVQGAKYEGRDASGGSDGKMVYLVGEAVSGAKVEPDYVSE
jgi:hypothetical protein